MSIPYSGLEDWPWRIMFDYNFNPREAGWFDWWEREDGTAGLRFANREDMMNLCVEFDPNLIEGDS